MKDTTWRKSSHSSSAGDQCVELARVEADVAIRDSKDPHGPPIVVSRTSLRTAIRLVEER